MAPPRITGYRAWSQHAAVTRQKAASRGSAGRSGYYQEQYRYPWW